MASYIREVANIYLTALTIYLNFLSKTTHNSVNESNIHVLKFFISNSLKDKKKILQFLSIYLYNYRQLVTHFQF